ncbi:MAG TPA: amino acid permease [Candidatus Saccharimonadales bacterium]|nr:amino acid permease [Candidatus Saccharimonadales bacterium]
MGKLKRTIGWKTYGLFGLGNIIGAGIYVLIGEVAGEAGNGAIWSFAVAGLVAGFTVLSYSALATKFPLSAAEAVFVLKSFSNRSLALLVGLTLVFAGIVSSGVLLNGFANYFSELIDLPKAIFIVSALVILAAIAIKGIKETAEFAVAITILEVLGLAIIIVLSYMSPDFVSHANQVITSSLEIGALPILFGSFLAFYAFIGFEDMVNVAEEVKNPTKNVKRGMLLAMVSAIVLYMFVAVAALSVIPAGQLAGYDAPLAAVFERTSNIDFPLITVIGLFAIVNGIIAQIIMCSRVLYGLSREKLIPSWFGKVSPKTKTPINSTILICTVMLIGALSLPLVTLASLTSLGLLFIFSVVHASCLKLRKKVDINPVFPTIGLALNIGIILVQIFQYF